MPVRYVRVLMLTSSGTPDSHGKTDPRNAMGYALYELAVGTLDAAGNFQDLVDHDPDRDSQTITYCSSVDPWHEPLDRVLDEEQPGLDLVFTSGLTRQLPVIIPVSVLYGVPEDAVAEISYLKSRGYRIAGVELGEEPDGQYMSPEDYGSLYLQWARALHGLDPALKLGGPVLQNTDEVGAWPDEHGNTSWVNRFINYLQAHSALSALSFFASEHYPFSAQDGYPSLADEPGLMAAAISRWHKEGVPASTPILLTECNFSADTTCKFQDIVGALWHADFVGSFLANGGKEMFYYEYEPTPLRSRTSPAPQGPTGCSWPMRSTGSGTGPRSSTPPGCS
jgi:hypothetical protein